ncbi:RNA metabolism protein [Lithospermum erythrorhizon]|uniref:RNA metabolism protein n=1 Tax=Lithospermum erythrorhizon TaxID=34254 RepID=A0AAV3P459_LITER
MKGIKRKDGTLEGNRRHKGVSKQVDALEKPVGHKGVSKQVDGLEKPVGRKKNKDMGLRKKNKLDISKTKKSREAETVEYEHPFEQNLHQEKKEDVNEVYQIPSEDERPLQGMRKWITDYYRSRPGLNVLQEKIDEFITAHEAQEEQARIEKEEKAAEGGWTVVVHHKGRKKTTDAESGISVGSVAQAAVMEKMATKKNKDVGLDFYRFQKREAKKNEIMMLQSKFEQDKKRMQELRAQRKFRPY